MPDIRIGDRVAIVAAPLGPAYGYVWPCTDPSDAELTRALGSAPAEVLDGAPAAWVVSDFRPLGAILLPLSVVVPVPRATCEAQTEDGAGICIEPFGHDLAGQPHTSIAARGMMRARVWESDPIAARAAFDALTAIGAAA
jgi:hypothetical protein